MVYSRPLDHYHCTFFFPFLPQKNMRQKYQVKPSLKPYKYESKNTTSDNDKKNSETWQQQELQEKKAQQHVNENQAYRYFSPIIRDQLYDIKDGNHTGFEPLREWRLELNDIKNWHLDVGDQKDKQTAPLSYQRANIERVHLYRYFNDVYLLAVSVAPTARTKLKEWAESSEEANEWAAWSAGMFTHDNNWWLTLALSPEPVWREVQQLQTAAWLNFTRLARILYPTFTEQELENKISRITLNKKDDKNGHKQIIFDGVKEVKEASFSTNVGKDISKVIVEGFLSEFFTCTDTSDQKKFPYFFEQYQEQYDDRMFVNASYSPVGQTFKEPELKRLFTFALYVDRPQDVIEPNHNGYVYHPETIEERVNKQSYTLWDGTGVRYGFTDFSNVYFGTGWFFRNVTGPRHVAYIYERMTLQALLYQNSLRHYTREITNLTTGMVTKDGQPNLNHQSRDEIRQLTSHFIQFTNQYWFHDISDQLQGKDIFRLQQQALELERNYAFIKEEMERMDEFTDTVHNFEMADRADKLAQYGFPIGIIALLLAIVPLVKKDDWKGPTNFPWDLPWITSFFDLFNIKITPLLINPWHIIFAISIPLIIYFLFSPWIITPFNKLLNQYSHRHKKKRLPTDKESLSLEKLKKIAAKLPRAVATTISFEKVKSILTSGALKGIKLALALTALIGYMIFISNKPTCDAPSLLCNKTSVEAQARVDNLLNLLTQLQTGNHLPLSSKDQPPIEKTPIAADKQVKNKNKLQPMVTAKTAKP